jgi:hypothetical protein
MEVVYWKLLFGKENYSNESKIFSIIKFKVLGSRADNNINNDMLACYTLQIKF